ncbi:MAG TPA: heavy metal translocating P-type ATPase [Candidatus Acidoferrum sp.]|jgi:heavy metal translocating P-type ATPase|nr:heavy metal translocating P-type ATPase [Candidatus Acidoferrum sp.]
MTASAKPGFAPTKETYIAGFTLVAIALHLLLKYALHFPALTYNLPLFAALLVGGVPMVWQLLKKLAKRQFGSDLLAGVSIVTAILLHEYLVAVIVVLMLSGGEALEEFATARASSVLDALARRMPSVAHRKNANRLVDVKLADIRIGDELTVLPHEICPVDGTVIEGHGVMDEAYLTGEPYEVSKTPGSQVISGAINGEALLVIRAEKLAEDSRYARIMKVMHETEEQRPQLRRLGDQLGAWYTPLALGVAIIAAFLSGNSERFLSVVVIATPCPLLLAIPTAIIGAISLAARRAIIIKNPAILEQIEKCQTLIFDKTGTLTYGRPTMTDVLCEQGVSREEVLQLVASAEQYSKHPLATAIVTAAKQQAIQLLPADQISERSGDGLRGQVAGHNVFVTGRGKVNQAGLKLPPLASGLECLVFLDEEYVAAIRLHDAPRKDSASFVQHLKPKHGVRKVMLLSGDRESEVKYLAESVGITEVHAGKSPEEKVAIVKEETAKARTLFVGDGINDAPALMAATVGVAFGTQNDITTEAADAVVLETSLGKIDELIHIGRRMRRIALQSALGGMAASMLGMVAAAFGFLPPIWGAVGQELIDLFAVLNAVRVALPTEDLQDY